MPARDRSGSYDRVVGVRRVILGTVAVRDPGLLREADGGLLFLDEIGELGTDEQAMLLRALEDRTFLPVGSDKPVKSDKPPKTEKPPKTDKPTKTDKPKKPKS